MSNIRCVVGYSGISCMKFNINDTACLILKK